MSWLRAFPAFRDLEARYKSQEGVIQYLREHGARVLEYNYDLTARLDEARKAHIKATETVADFGFQLKYGRKLFDHVPELPESAPEIPFEGIRKSRPQARDLVAQAEREFLESLNPPKKEPTQ